MAKRRTVVIRDMIQFLPNTIIPHRVLTELLVLAALWGVNEAITRSLRRLLDRHSLPSWQDRAGLRTGLQYVEQEKPEDVRLVQTSWGTGALFKARRREIVVAGPSLNHRDLETMWTVCHELWHPTQVSPFWRWVRQIQYVGEVGWLLDLLLIICRDGDRALRAMIAPSLLVGIALIAGLCYLWGDFLPELDAVQHTSDMFTRGGLTWIDPTAAQNWVNQQTQFLIVQYLSASLAITVTLTLLVIMISQVMIR